MGGCVIEQEVYVYLLGAPLKNTLRQLCLTIISHLVKNNLYQNISVCLFVDLFIAICMCLCNAHLLIMGYGTTKSA